MRGEMPAEEFSALGQLEQLVLGQLCTAHLTAGSPALCLAALDHLIRCGLLFWDMKCSAVHFTLPVYSMQYFIGQWADDISLFISLVSLNFSSCSRITLSSHRSTAFSEPRSCDAVQQNAEGAANPALLDAALLTMRALLALHRSVLSSCCILTLIYPAG